MLLSHLLKSSCSKQPSFQVLLPQPQNPIGKKTANNYEKKDYFPERDARPDPTIIHHNNAFYQGLHRCHLQIPIQYLWFFYRSSRAYAKSATNITILLPLILLLQAYMENTSARKKYSRNPFSICLYNINQCANARDSFLDPESTFNIFSAQ